MIIPSPVLPVPWLAPVEDYDRRHYYSVPYQLVHEHVDIRLTATTVEAFFKGRRVASHKRSFARGGFTTAPEHMPASHRKHAEWTPSRIIRWAETAGPQTATWVDGVMQTRRHPEQGYRACLGVLRLGKRYGSDRLEAACSRALAIRSFSYRSIESILKSGLDRQPLPAAETSPEPPCPHEFVRGPAYYETASTNANGSHGGQTDADQRNPGATAGTELVRNGTGAQRADRER